MRHRTLALPALALLLASAAQGQTEYYVTRSSTTASSATSTTIASRRLPRRAHSKGRTGDCQSTLSLPLTTERAAHPLAVNARWRLGMPKCTSTISGTVSRDSLGRTLNLWIIRQRPIAAADLPTSCCRRRARDFRLRPSQVASPRPSPLGHFIGDLPPDKWVEVRVPMALLHSGVRVSIHPGAAAERRVPSGSRRRRRAHAPRGPGARGVTTPSTTAREQSLATSVPVRVRRRDTSATS